MEPIARDGLTGGLRAWNFSRLFTTQAPTEAARLASAHFAAEQGPR